MPNSLKYYGLHRRLLLSLLPVVLLTAGVVLALLIQDANQRSSEIRLEHTKQQVQTLSQGSLDALITEEYDLLSRWTNAVVPGKDFAYASIDRIDGKILTHTNVDFVGHDVQYISTSTTYSTRKSNYLDRPILISTYPVSVRHEHLANAHVAYYTDTEITLDKQALLRLSEPARR